jgi:tetratricopeptide (TPR) repeat protein
MILVGVLGAFLLTQAQGQPPTAPAREDPLRRARNEYAYGNYQEAADALRDLLYPMRLSTDGQVIEARKYLALSYYLLDKMDAVQDEFAKLLYLDPDYLLDPFSVAPSVIECFEGVRRRLKTQLDNIRQRKSEERVPRANPLVRVEYTRYVEHSDFASFMPFGTGQFQNGDVGWGVMFCMTEVALLAVNVGSYLWGLQLLHYRADQRGLVRTLNITQYASLALLGSVWGAGVFHARLHFNPLVPDPASAHEELTQQSRPLGLLLSWTY